MTRFTAVPLTVVALGFKALRASWVCSGEQPRRGHGCRTFCPQLGVPCSSYVATSGPKVDNFGWVAVSRCALNQGCSSLSRPNPRANPVPHIDDVLLYANNAESGLSGGVADKS